jgi:5-methylcytosine-specific restriction endonuclease McrBC regulatory subunit McrC
MPLRSPVSGQVEHGLVIQPRFGWDGIGAMLAGTGATVLPQLPRMPALPRADTGVPPWVISAVVLSRLEAFMQHSPRRFAEVNALCDRPRGRIHWGKYISEHLARAHPESVPCAYSALQQDEALLGAIHATALKQLQSLASVRADALIVRRLMDRFQTVRHATCFTRPRWDALSIASGRRDVNDQADAIEAMLWTRDDRGLGGLSDSNGLAWMLPMEEVFETWIETLVRELAKVVGGSVRTGRQRDTLRPLYWNPPYSGSQRYLLPDVELIRDDETVIFDAKYKSHWEEIDEERWHGVRNETREAHRSDLLQVLAYAGATSASRVTCVLVYPCHESTWQSLRLRQRQYHVAEVPAGARTVRLLLIALPLAGQRQVLAAEFARCLAPT